MLFFVPDLESYVAARPPVMPFAETSPGPCVRTISELVSHVRRHTELSNAYADALCQFNDRFNALNDGRVTGTVLETFLDPAMPWRTA